MNKDSPPPPPWPCANLPLPFPAGPHATATPLNPALSQVGTEDEVLQAILRWVATDSARRAAHLPKLLPTVRWPYLSAFALRGLSSEDAAHAPHLLSSLGGVFAGGGAPPPPPRSLRHHGWASRGCALELHGRFTHAQPQCLDRCGGYQGRAVRARRGPPPNAVSWCRVNPLRARCSTAAVLSVRHVRNGLCCVRQLCRCVDCVGDVFLHTTVKKSSKREQNGQGSKQMRKKRF